MSVKVYVGSRLVKEVDKVEVEDVKNIAKEFGIKKFYVTKVYKPVSELEPQDYYKAVDFPITQGEVHIIAVPAGA